MIFPFFAIALIRKYKNNPDVSITFVNEKKNHYSFLKGNFARFFLCFDDDVFRFFAKN